MGFGKSLAKWLQGQFSLIDLVTWCMLISEGKRTKEISEGKTMLKSGCVAVFMSVKDFTVNPEKGSGRYLTCLRTPSWALQTMVDYMEVGTDHNSLFGSTGAKCPPKAVTDSVRFWTWPWRQIRPSSPQVPHLYLRAGSELSVTLPCPPSALGGHWALLSPFGHGK